MAVICGDSVRRRPILDGGGRWRRFVADGSEGSTAAQTGLWAAFLAPPTPHGSLLTIRFGGLAGMACGVSYTGRTGSDGGVRDAPKSGLIGAELGPSAAQTQGIHLRLTGPIVRLLGRRFGAGGTYSAGYWRR